MAGVGQEAFGQILLRNDGDPSTSREGAGWVVLIPAYLQERRAVRQALAPVSPFVGRPQFATMALHQRAGSERHVEFGQGWPPPFDPGCVEDYELLIKQPE